MVLNINWELQGCCRHNQVVFIAAVGVSTVVILAVSPSNPSPPLYLISPSGVGAS
jgi:hypothetical protein